MDSQLALLRKHLKEKSLDALFISSLPNIAYLTGYAKFSAQDRDAFVLITQNSQYIFTHGIYKEDVKKNVKNFTLIDIKRENPISTAVKNLIDEHGIKKLGFEAFDLKVSEYERLTKQIDNNILTSSDLVNNIRIHKTTDEIAALKNACALGDKAFRFIQKKIIEGISESELAAQLDYFIKSEGADISFPTIVAFEENAAHPHHIPTNKKLAKNNYVLMDFGVLLNGYCSDMTRTVYFGEINNEKKRVYETVHEAQQKAVDYIEEKLSNKDIIQASTADKIARDHIVSKGYPAMPHSLGHGIGLEVHEEPRLTPVTDDLLEEGMVFSIEPGIYLPDKVGVRIEDLFAIENNSLVRITLAPRNLIEL